MQIIKQTTYESCLPCSLLMIADGNIEDEIEIWRHGWKFNYLIGQLNFVSEKYDKILTAYIENEYYFDQLQLQKGNQVNLINENIDIKLIEKLLESNNVIVYLDCYYLQGILHAPHFIVATKITSRDIEIADPADGKIKLIPIEIIDKAIASLRNHLKYSPVLITMPKK